MRKLVIYLFCALVLASQLSGCYWMHWHDHHDGGGYHGGDGDHGYDR